MTVLSSSAVLKLMRRGKIYLSPILDPEKQIGPISIDLRLGHVALFVRASGLSHVDPRNYVAEELNEQQRERSRRQKFSRFEFTFKQPLLLHPNSLTLVPTLEWIHLPLDLMGVVTARSSWAREGLNIATANFINPGYNGIITLELANFGQIPIALYPGMRIAQIAFHTVGEKAAQVRSSQFNLSFEPRGGEIADGDEAFIGTRNDRSESTSPRIEAMQASTSDAPVPSGPTHGPTAEDSLQKRIKKSKR